MDWYLVAFLVLFIVAAIAFWLVRRPRPHAHRIRRDTLYDALSQRGVDPAADPTPPADLLQLHMRASDTIHAATRAHLRNKKAIVALLDDRVVYVAATVGPMGAEAHTLAYDQIQEIETEADVGGTIHMETRKGPLEFTHIPLSHFADVTNELHRHVHAEPPAQAPLRPATGPSA